jgi:hypothetical protein
MSRSEPGGCASYESIESCEQIKTNVGKECENAGDIFKKY